MDRNNLPSRCAAKPDPGFCTKGCRTDADCNGFGEAAYCIELGQDFPNGERSIITACYPASELFLTTPTPCTTDTECDAGAGEGCLLLSAHSEQRVCGASACSADSVVGIYPAGCTATPDCRQADGLTCVSGACVGALVPHPDTLDTGLAFPLASGP